MVIPVVIAGECAKRVLANSPMLEVLGHTSQVVFLVAGEEVLWVTSPAGELHRRTLRAQRLPHWSLGTTVFVEDEKLCAEEECLDLAGARIWANPPLPQPLRNFQALARTLLEDFSPFYPSVRATLGPGWWERCREALSQADILRFLSLAKERIGRGPGLTPLADDFLGGALFALRALFSEQAWPSATVEDFLAWAKGHTHRLSLCFLADLSRGHGPESLHTFAGALFAGEEEAARDCARDLLNLGQSTGAALLLGALFAWSEFRKGANGGGAERAY